jgi:hypothetical protein
MKPASDTSAPESTSRTTADASGNGHGDAYVGTPADAFKSAGARFVELREYVGYFVSAKVDGIKLTFRNIALYAVLGLVAGVVGLGLLVTAAVLLLTGLAGAIGAIFEPDKPWLGALIVGFVVLVGVFVGVWLVMKKVTGASHRATVQRYENRKRDERGQFEGHDVQERAREHAQQL